MIKNIGRFKIALNIASPTDDNTRASAPTPYTLKAAYEKEPSGAIKSSAANASLYRLSTSRISSSQIKPPINNAKKKA